MSIEVINFSINSKTNMNLGAIALLLFLKQWRTVKQCSQLLGVSEKDIIHYIRFISLDGGYKVYEGVNSTYMAHQVATCSLLILYIRSKSYPL